MRRAAQAQRGLGHSLADGDETAVILGLLLLLLTLLAREDEYAARCATRTHRIDEPANNLAAGECEHAAGRPAGAHGIDEPSDDGTTATSITASGLYRVDVAGLESVLGLVSSWPSGTVTMKSKTVIG